MTPGRSQASIQVRRGALDRADGGQQAHGYRHVHAGIGTRSLASRCRRAWRSGSSSTAFWRAWISHSSPSGWSSGARQPSSVLAGSGGATAPPGRYALAVLGRLVLLVGMVCVAGACASVRRPEPAPAPATPAAGRELKVTASAYNSLPDQTEGDPAITASGERLRPGMRALAVSDDLFDAGLGFGTLVEIEGVPGEWVVLDRMASHWRRKIDLYMGRDRERALAFGKRRVRIRWRPAE